MPSVFTMQGGFAIQYVTQGMDILHNYHAWMDLGFSDGGG